MPLTNKSMMFACTVICDFIHTGLQRSGELSGLLANCKLDFEEHGELIKHYDEWPSPWCSVRPWPFLELIFIRINEQWVYMPSRQSVRSKPYYCFGIKRNIFFGLFVYWVFSKPTESLNCFCWKHFTWPLCIKLFFAPGVLFQRRGSMFKWCLFQCK